jgi:hypothetical protein
MFDIDKAIGQWLINVRFCEGLRMPAPGVRRAAIMGPPSANLHRFGLMHRSKHLKLFDHFRGAGEQKMRDCDLAELARVKRVNFPKAICA